ncbi:DUF5606 domain-containing protein [Pedobacter sp. JY14-1]|uniref:DUF5606 family protein n=1 Tax=Pedobacter sp. JY14-1 TaxID=3034151 RepID=UPI0023E1352D|nr:DUF5606 domain-containing protein [Pedobacter sp. JY14-1]
MNLRGIVAVSGRPGLFRLVGQNKAGYILESLDAQKVKIVANLATAKLASLEDITVYGEDEDLKLADVFTNIAAASEVPDGKADAAALKKLFEEVVPAYDRDKVYTSDMKKIVSWYHILKDTPAFTEELPAENGPEAVKVEDKPAEKKPKTPKPAANAKAPAKTAQPAKKANMTSKKGV